MKRSLLLALLLLTGSACSNQAPYATTVGVLAPGSTMTVRVSNATVNAFAPAAGQPSDRFTVAATAPRNKAPGPPRLTPLPRAAGVLVAASDPLASLLVRVPDEVNLVVDSQSGDVHVTNVTGAVRVSTAQGNVQIIVPGYAQVHTGRGNISVTMGSTDWPGTLVFGTSQGDIEVWITETAAFRVHLHTDNGTLFSDFDLRGVSQGRSETIDGVVNGGSNRSIDIEDSAGTIRLLRLHPQA